MRTITFLLLVGVAAAVAFGQEDDGRRRPDEYSSVVERTAAMANDPEARRVARRYGLDIGNLTWEDTARFKDSSVGPNISDMTIQVPGLWDRLGRRGLACMPVVRHSNFSDKTGDISLDKFFLIVGNERGGRLRRVSLREYLGGFRNFLSDSNCWGGRERSLLSPRDSHALVSAQACFLPIPRNGVAEFNPAIFNYQSSQGNPAVLAILATQEGTSATVIDNHRDGFVWSGMRGQRLFFNQNGRRAMLAGQRMSDIGGWGKEESRNGGRPGLSVVLLIQVPLIQRNIRPEPLAAGEGGGKFDAAKAKPSAEQRGSDVEDAVISHGRIEGPFAEVDNLAIERDPRYPIRVTVQFYKATSNEVVTDDDMAVIASQIEKIYRDADYVGSLVTEGFTGRPTEWDSGPVVRPVPEPWQPQKAEAAVSSDWFDRFWRRYQVNSGRSAEEAKRFLREHFGPGWEEKSWEELASALDRAGLR